MARFVSASDATGQSRWKYAKALWWLSRSASYWAILAFSIGNWIDWASYSLGLEKSSIVLTQVWSLVEGQQED